LPIVRSKVACGGAEVGERGRDDGRVRIQGRGNGGGDRVEFDAGDACCWRGEADEVAGAGLEDAAAGEAELGGGGPDGLYQCGVGVVGVERVAGGGRTFPGGQQGGELVAGPGELGAGGVEDLGDGAPAGPAGQDLLLGGGGRAFLCFELVQRGQGGEVGADAGYCS